MAAKTVKLENFAKELKKFTKATLEEQQVAVGTAIINQIPKLVEASPVDTGQYASSWDFTINEKSAVLGNYAPHAPIIERGARPFVPPIDPLLSWAKRVLRSPSQPPNYDSEVWALAKGTQQKIAKYGMKPRNVLEKQIPEIIKGIETELKRGGR